jgi:hypothetical protein
MSGRRGLLGRAALAAALAIVALASVATPALADKWKRHGHYYGDYDGRYVVGSAYAYGGYYVAPRVYYPPPPVVYYAPPPPPRVVYYAPPPVVYVPPPAPYYAPSFLSFGITLPLH